MVSSDGRRYRSQWYTTPSYILKKPVGTKKACVSRIYSDTLTFIELTVIHMEEGIISDANGVRTIW